MTDQLGSNSKQELIALAERINGLEDELAEITGQVKELREQIKDEKKRAASSGFDKKALDRVLKELRMDADQRQGQLELEVVTDTYRKALDLPTYEDLLADAARKRISGGKGIVESMVDAAVERGDLTETDEPGVYEMPQSKRDKKHNSRATLQVVKD